MNDRSASLAAAVRRISPAKAVLFSLRALALAFALSAAHAAPARIDAGVLRVREDIEHHRRWVLTAGDVAVYDTRSSVLIRRIPLPSWYILDDLYACPLDIAIDRRGAAFVSNNVEPLLLEIDPVRLRTKQHRLQLASRKQWDVGFGAVAFAADGTFFALSAVGGAVFRIDLARGVATEIGAAPQPARACALPGAMAGY